MLVDLRLGRIVSLQNPEYVVYRWQSGSRGIKDLIRGTEYKKKAYLYVFTNICKCRCFWNNVIWPQAHTLVGKSPVFFQLG